MQTNQNKYDKNKMYSTFTIHKLGALNENELL